MAAISFAKPARALGQRLTATIAVSRVAVRPGIACRAEVEQKEMAGVSEMTFRPFQEVSEELAMVSRAESTDQSFARSGYHPDIEAAINEQINIEYNISYVYHALYAYFDRDNVGLPGFAKYFKDASDEEREHAEKLMDFQTKRGGRVKLQSIVMPEMEFSNDEKGEALYAMELALSLEKLNFQKLRAVQAVGDRCEDAEMTHFIESEFLSQQAEDIKRVAGYVSQLRRVGTGLGVWEFDRNLA